MKNIFKFETDSQDIVNDISSDVQWFVDKSAWDTLVSSQSINPANASYLHDAAAAANDVTPDFAHPITVNITAANKQMVAHDFVRYIAYKLFNTHLGVDLFDNEKELLQNVRAVCNATTPADPSVDPHPAMYVLSQAMANAGTSSAPIFMPVGDVANITQEQIASNAQNIVRSLFKQLITADVSRLTTLAPEVDNIFKFPFHAGDALVFKLTVNAASGQNALTGVSAIAPRVYGIKLVLVSGEVINTAVATDEL
jgi:hypothetical protein